MRNSFIYIVFFISSFTLLAQKPNLKLKATQSKYENFYFKSPQKYNNKAQKFTISKVVFSTSYKGSETKNKYQILVTGKVNNNEERILYNAKNIDELNYYKNIFNRKYKKVLLTEYSYFVSSKKYYDTSISVEF
ncbi:hypothetical protein WH52_00465 [Tenacibaculum holothuriorum]|uniref:Uncharacterized protein n=1 Tax=Tenacibaculum holothuriorum TaxID=1635173 RepID=A0A1Y2PFF8_9FLAO|nr:hypothetical protein [Tenacibaculum holothuriorum]OSY89165.1 hypothetical protein WH52_00465 [Tenacibaculum holothuriorum]